MQLKFPNKMSNYFFKANTFIGFLNFSTSPPELPLRADIDDHDWPL